MVGFHFIHVEKFFRFFVLFFEIDFFFFFFGEIKKFLVKEGTRNLYLFAKIILLVFGLIIKNRLDIRIKI